MKKNCIWFYGLIIVLFAGCTAAPTKDITVDVEVNPKATFSEYKSYGWLVTAQILNDPKGQWEPPDFDADAEIKYLIDTQLRKRGMSENTVNPDVIVAFAAGIDMDALELKIDPETKMDTLENAPQGALIVVLVDSASGFVAWVGTATAKVLEKPDSATVKARLDYAVKQMFKKLPK